LSAGYQPLSQFPHFWDNRYRARKPSLVSFSLL
jgi:hypothetical protein